MPILLVPFILVAVFLGTLLLIALLFPLGVVQRYRVGTSRRRVRGWLALFNSLSLALSTSLLLATAVLTSLWEPRALPYVAAGLAAGALLGALGLAISRWEETPDGLYVTSKRWLVLSLILVVVARFAYGIWRAASTVLAGAGDDTWLASAGVPGSLAAGALIIGYSLVFWLGVRRRVERYRRRREPL